MKNMMDPELIKDEELHKMLMEIEHEMYNLMNSEMALMHGHTGMPMYWFQILLKIYIYV